MTAPTRSRRRWSSAALTRKGLLTAGAGEGRPVAANNTPEGRALNGRVELIRFTDSAEASRIGSSDEESMIFGAPTRIVLCLLIGVLVGLIGVALGASLIMVLLVALTAAALTAIIAKERG